MNIPLSKFFTSFLLVLFIFCTFLTLKTISITYKNTTKAYLTHERLVKDVLSTLDVPVKEGAILYKPLQEGMAIEITDNQLVRIQE